MRKSNDADPRQFSAKAEFQQFLETRVVRRRLFPRAILVGVVAGGLAAAFRTSLNLADSFRAWLMHQVPANPVALALGATAIAAVGTWVSMSIGQVDKDAGGSGIPHMKAVLEGHSTMTWARLIAVKFSAALAAIGSGLALGREGPTVQMGGAAGIAVAEHTGASARERRALAAAGAGAGLAAAFNAPLAGVTFVLEELQRDFQPVVFGAALLSAAIATVVSRIASGQVPVFSVPVIAAPSLEFIPLFILIGALAGVLGVVFNRGLISSSTIIGRLRERSRPAVALLVGLVVGGSFLVSPSLLGGGHGVTEAALHGDLLLGSAVAYLAVRLVLIHISYASGVPGGIFAPLLSLGALLGVIAYKASEMVFPSGPGVAACAVAGMCGLFSGIVRAPLTGIILIAEMTGSYDLLLPLLASAFTAYAVAEALGDMPIYEALLQRDALKKGWDIDDGELLTAEFEIKAGSAFDGCSIRDIRLPPGVLVVLCKSGGKEFVPKADTELHQNMRIVIATSSPAGLREVEQGTASGVARVGKR